MAGGKIGKSRNNILTEKESAIYCIWYILIYKLYKPMQFSLPALADITDPIMLKAIKAPLQDIIINGSP
jgi:uncharacterized membrane protein